MLAEVAARIGRNTRRRDAAGALRGARAGLSHGAPELRHDAAPAEQVDRVAQGSGAPARGRAQQPRTAQSQGSDSRTHRRLRAVHRAVSRGACRLSAAAEGVDESRPRVEDGRTTTPRASRPIESCIELAPHLGEVWWSLANLKTFRFTRVRNRDHARAARARRSHQRRPLPLPFLAGQGTRGCGRVRGLVRLITEGQRAAPQADSPRRRGKPPITCSARSGSSRASSSRNAPAGAATRAIRSSSSACRAPVPRWSSRSWRHTQGGGHAGAARHHHDRARGRQAHLARRRRPPIRARSRSSRPGSCASSASATWRRPAFNVKRARRSSSTRCLITSHMSV